ncbi:MAG: hypothetical protein HYY06_10980 [Deltaproteobacteria bacterium]|nr:hypothetical protein [Deltaproteobacteria bacterium]
MRPSWLAPAVLALLFPVAAAAQEGVEPERRGLSVQGLLGLSDCLGEYCDDGTYAFEETRVGVGIAGSAWYRPIALVGLGGGLHYNIIGTDDESGVDSSGDYFNLEVGGRVYPLERGPADLFAGLGLGYTFMGTSWDTDSDVSEGSFTFRGITLSMAAGGEYYFAPQMSAGLLFKLYFPFWSSGCLEEDGMFDYDDCDDIEDFEDVILGFDADDLPSIWFLGGTFSYHLAT